VEIRQHSVVRVISIDIDPVEITIRKAPSGFEGRCAVDHDSLIAGKTGDDRIHYSVHIALILCNRSPIHPFGQTRDELPWIDEVQFARVAELNDAARESALPNADFGAHAAARGRKKRVEAAYTALQCPEKILCSLHPLTSQP